MPQMPSYAEQQQSRNALALQGMQLQEGKMKLEDAMRERQGLAQLQQALSEKGVNADPEEVMDMLAQHAAQTGDAATYQKAQEARLQIRKAKQADALFGAYGGSATGATPTSTVAAAPQGNMLAPATAPAAPANAMAAGPSLEQTRDLGMKLVQLGDPRGQQILQNLPHMFPQSKMGEMPELVKLQQYAAQLPPGSPERRAIDARITKLTTEPAADQGLELSPEGLDLATNVYLQTGQLPPGMGAKASELKAKIIDRAAQLSGGKSSEEAAGSLVSAKQTRASEQATLRDFNAGLSARRVTANNTALNHLETMDRLVNDLDSTDTRIVNRAATLFAKETGAPAPTNFDAAKQIVAAEVIKAVVQNGGGVTERQDAARAFSTANSPEQLREVINTYRELLGGQLQTLKLQYETGTNRKDFDEKLTPAARKFLGQFESTQTEPSAAPAFPNAPPIGTIAKGHKYIGGDPADPKSWERQ